MTDGAAQPWLADIEPGQVTPLITSDERVIRVQAGPGTGKTLGIRRRVLRLLHPDGLNLDPDRVLVCAFNRAIAKDLKDEITQQLEPHGLPLPQIKTIHSLCSEIARTEARFLLPHEIEEMVYDVRAANASLRAEFGRHSDAMRALREHEAGLQSHPALMQAVREWLADHGAALVGDSPRNVERAMAAGQTPVRLYDHVIVDEFQDLTATEAKVVTSLRSEDSYLVAVGDHKQSIYAFRGNDTKGLASLPELVEEPISDHPMDQCWRCRSEVVVLANGVMALEGEPLQDVRGPGAELHVLHFRNPGTEAERIAREAVRIYQTRPDTKHLVLATRRKWGYDLKSKIREIDATVPVETIFAEDVLQSWAAREAFIFLCVLADPDDAVALRDWVAYQEDDEGKSFKAPARNAEAYLVLKDRIGALSVAKIEELRDEAELSFGGTGRGKLVTRLRRLVGLMEGFDIERPPDEVVQDVFDPARWLDYSGEVADLAAADLGRLKTESLRLLDEDANLGVLVAKLRYRIATREPLGAEASGGNAIRIVTLWGAKGLTADYVYVIGLADEALPGVHEPDETGLTEAEHLAEQRRLLYVSLTRAKQALVISRAEKLRLGEVAALGLRRTGRRNRGWQYLTPCRFFSDLPSGAFPESTPGEPWVGLARP